MEMGTETIRYDIAEMQHHTRRTELEVKPENGTYQFVAIKLNPDISLQDGAERLRCTLADAQADVKILTWKQAIGSVGQFAALSQGILFVFVLFVFFVAALVITNTLSMAAIERVSEIGMMRAIGARKSFIGQMFFTEIM